MICNFPDWWELPTYVGFKYHVNVNKYLEDCSGERIKVGEEEDGTITLNIEYNKLPENQVKNMAKQLLYMVQK